MAASKFSEDQKKLWYELAARPHNDQVRTASKNEFATTIPYFFLTFRLAGGLVFERILEQRWLQEECRRCLGICWEGNPFFGSIEWSTLIELRKLCESKGRSFEGMQQIIFYLRSKCWNQELRKNSNHNLLQILIRISGCACLNTCFSSTKRTPSHLFLLHRVSAATVLLPLVSIIRLTGESISSALLSRLEAQKEAARKSAEAEKAAQVGVAQ